MGHLGRGIALAALCVPLGILPALAQAPPEAPGAFQTGDAEDAVPAEAAIPHPDRALPAALMQVVADGNPAPHSDAPSRPAGYRWRGPMPAEPDREGAVRDAWYFLSYQIVAVGTLYLLPGSISNWSDEDKSNYSFSKWRYNVTHPVFDNDAWYINWVLHPYWGGAYYIRGRERGLDRTESFWYSTVMSLLWEYGAEALAEQVSITDMIVTPVLGSLLGEYVFAPWRERIRARAGELDWTDKAILVLTDPLGVINAQIDSWLGVKSSVQVAPMGLRAPGLRRDPALAGLPASPGRPSGWALQVRIDW